MENNNLKNIVVLKNLPSNIAEEAIIFLKPNLKVKNYKYVENKNESNNSNKIHEDKNKNLSSKKNNNSKEYIIKEAEMLISSYLTRIEKQKEKNVINYKLQNKYKRLKTLTIILGIMLVCGILSHLGTF